MENNNYNAQNNSTELTMEQKHKADILTIWVLILLIGVQVLALVINAAINNILGADYMAAGVISFIIWMAAGIAWIVGFILLIYLRVKYKKHLFSKVVAIVYILFMVVVIIVIALFFIWMINVLNEACNSCNSLCENMEACATILSLLRGELNIFTQ